MTSSKLTFGRKIGLGYGALTAISLVIGAVAVYGMRTVVRQSNEVLDINAQNVIDCGRLQFEAIGRIAANRGYLLSRDNEFVDAMRVGRTRFAAQLESITRRGLSASDAALAGRIERVSHETSNVADKVVEMRRLDRPSFEVIKQFQELVIPKNRELRTAIAELSDSQEREMSAVRQKSNTAAALASNMVIGFAVMGIGLAAVLAAFMTHTLKRQIGSAVVHIQSSSNELHAAATQQTSGSREQAASTNEIATTIRELVATARQIAESAQRVAAVAEQTAQGARSGDETLERAQAAVVDIKRQVDLIVAHMLELGGKSQHISGILEIINEMAEQTNILSINASIEAAGAGETGRRFGVVADEIRKLADRVGGSTKEIKSLIEEIRSAVHTTVMATESGSKAVDAGSREFREVSSAFQKIMNLVETTTQASREIELSTKQQTTAVEQVNTAIGNVALTAKESEVSCVQTLQTVSELTALSQNLSRLIWSQSAA